MDNTNQESGKSELIAVFKKDISEDKAEEWLQNNDIRDYRQGMDSSRGKIYFYSTGPKFILTFSSQTEKEAFLRATKSRKEIHELYTPDWKIQKD